MIRAQYFSKPSFQSRFSNGDVGSDSQQSDKRQEYDEKAELVKYGQGEGTLAVARLVLKNVTFSERRKRKSRSGISRRKPSKRINLVRRGLFDDNHMLEGKAFDRRRRK